MRINVCLLYNEMMHQNKRDASFLPIYMLYGICCSIREMLH